ncbi:MAG: hypothetical protein SPL55_04445 [Prevotella sp.]|nr:hypothetical protein [Prevotella sp.]
MKKYIINLNILAALLVFAFSFTSCLSDGDETVSLEFANVKKMIVGEWVLESNSGTPRVLIFTDDGYYTDSSDGGTKKHPWRLASDYSEGQPYYGGIYLDGVYYDIVSWGDGHWRLKDKNGKILDFSRDGGTDSNDSTNDVSSSDYVDLGLPSGTLWATHNVGATKPEEVGDFFAWGETEPKDVYNYENYKYGRYYYTKYNLVDNKAELDFEDDAAYVNWGKQWRMPTFNQIKELVDGCTWSFTMQEMWNDSHTYMYVLYICKGIGKNGHSIYFPHRSDYDYIAEPNYANMIRGDEYWSRSLYITEKNYPDPDWARYLKLPSSYGDVVSYDWWGGHARVGGRLIRPVRIN